LQSLVSQAKQLGKNLYVFSIDPETSKVAHANYVSPALKGKGADARTWASKVTDILGGKVWSFIYQFQMDCHLFLFRLEARMIVPKALASILTGLEMRWMLQIHISLGSFHNY